VHDWVYVAGGWNGEASQLGLVEVRNPLNGQWQPAPTLNIPRSQHALIAANGCLWAVAGWSADQGLVSAVERLSPCHPVTPAPCQAWQIITHLPTPRREPGVALFAGEIVVAGGFDGSSDADLDGYSDRVERYDPARDQWRRLPALHVPRRGLLLVAVQDRLIALGGYNADGFSNVVEEYDPQHDRWSVLDWPITRRTWAAATVIEGDILVAGGYNEDGFLGLIERLNPQTGQLCHPPPLPIARSWFALATTGEGLLALGGETAQGFSASSEWVKTTCL
jgi:N-acetylneuraminic acid mutarotase